MQKTQAVSDLLVERGVLAKYSVYRAKLQLQNATSIFERALAHLSESECAEVTRRTAERYPETL